MFDSLTYKLLDTMTYRAHIWENSRSIWKWFMVPPLAIMVLVLVLAWFVDRLRAAFACCGTCCGDVGDSMGKTKTTYYVDGRKTHSKTEDDGDSCYCASLILMLVAFALFLVTIALLLVALIFFCLSSVWLLKNENPRLTYEYVGSDDFGKKLYSDTSPYGDSKNFYKGNVVTSRLEMRGHIRTKGKYMLISVEDATFWRRVEDDNVDVEIGGSSSAPSS